MISNKTNSIGHIQTERVGQNDKDPFNYQTAEGKEAFGGKDIGTVLNKLADPNWIDPAKRRKVGSSELDKDAFLKLMLEQIKNQDPTNPQKSHEMAAQLAQFSSLEQLQNMNTGIEDLVKAQAPNERFQALSMIGRMVTSDSSNITHTEGQEEHSIKFNLANEAKQVEIKLTDNQGNVVRTYDFHNLKKGENSVTWNAKDDEGYNARPGDYRVVINAKGENGQTVPADTKISGKITGVNFGPEGPVLLVGKQSVKLQDVKQIEAAENSQDQSKKMNDITSQDLKNKDKVAENKGERPVGNLDNIAMQKALKDKLDKVNK